MANGMYLHLRPEMNKPEVIDLKLVQCDPTDLRGIPTPVVARPPSSGKSVFFSGKGSEMAAFLQSLPLADEADQKAVYNLVTDRQISNYILPKGVVRK